MNLEDAYAARKVGKFKEALKIYQAVLVEMPDTAKAYEGMAICWFFLKDYKKALSAASQALESDSSLYLPHLVLAEVYHLHGRAKEAENELNEAVKKTPDSPYVLNAQGMSLSRKNRPVEAVEVFVKALKVSPDKSFTHTVHVNLGYTYWRGRKYKQAAQEYKIANELMPSLRIAFASWAAKYAWLYFPVYYLMIIALSLALMYITALITRDYPTVTFLVFVLAVGILIFRLRKRRATG